MLSETGVSAIRAEQHIVAWSIDDGELVVSDCISWTRKTSVDNGSFIYGQSADSLVEAVAGTCVLLSRTVLTPDDTKRPNKDSK